jgi:hypothetical protein
VEIDTWDTENIQDVVDNSELKFFNPLDIEALWIPYWKAIISSAAQQ